MLDKLKSLFVVEDEEQNIPKEKQEEGQDVQVTQEEASTSEPVAQKSNRGSGTVDVKITEKLLSAIDQNNLDGFDYLEYKNALKALEKLPMDEATKFRSAYATAATIGATLEGLVKSAKFYIGILDKENQTFLSSYDKQVKQNISSKEDDLVEFDNIIKLKSEQIMILTQEIQKHQREIEQIKAKLTESKQMMQSTQENFRTSYLTLRRHLEEDVVKMEEYLK